MRANEIERKRKFYRLHKVKKKMENYCTSALLRRPPLVFSEPNGGAPKILLEGIIIEFIIIVLRVDDRVMVKENSRSFLGFARCRGCIV